MAYTRKAFIQKAGLGLLAGSTFSSINPLIADKPAASERLKFGMASYTLRKFTLDEVIAITQKLGLKHLALKDMHLPMDCPAEMLKTMTEKVRSAGIDLYGGGVIYMKTEEEVNKAFAYAANAGFKMIIGAPSHTLLNLVDQKVKETNIMLAIHNHGPGDEVYPSPESVYEKIKGLDKRIGLCIDIGHTQRIGQDPAKMAAKFADRLYDIHIKDVTGSTGKDTPLEIGRGVIDIPAFLKTLNKIKYQGIVSLEYEKDANDPIPGASESIGYLKGVMRMV
ncbi:sugar phosphate isomerase/epimerase [Rhodocytophaga rosea]|uniref:Sugar phosphate isomerase/epimerase n=1 Tax=Rhodocytophaga rosea TaxID=2704465 RepID=A0A6C0GSU6_9BACT|nr:sugar phosphate isomerase/epimerase family protein [Rhodocytophaga rosea]QHT71241.1 sugar phosphate isomerase/epimerase [Rhodocytophaga rosea]